MCEGWSFNNVGDSASNLTQIKQWGVTQAKHIDFGDCTNLSGQIPTPVKNSSTTVESFRMLFYNCTNLNSQIPENLFYNATNVITLRNAFNISGVTGNIPENLFINQSQLTLRSCFRYCSGLSDSQIRLTAQNIRETDYFCEGVNAKITVYIPRGMENPFTSTSNVTVVEYDI